MIRFACPTCAAVFSVADEKAGKAGKCPKCQAQFLIPTVADIAGAVSPPPPPPASDSVEIAPCPKCQARLSVGRDDLGASVECPYCKAVYIAQLPGAAPPRRSLADALGQSGTGGLKPVERADPPADEERPSRRSRRRDEDDEEEEEPRPRRRRPRRYERPHRGTLILTLGILSFVFCGIFTGLPAMIMGGNDLKAMDRGDMDPSGRGSTQAGRILGIVNVSITCVVLLFYCGLFAVVGLGGGFKNFAPPPAQRGR